jgi:cytidylate kinase
VVAIDGPAGSGKSTVARGVAEALGYLYVDTGAMYRAVAFRALDSGIDPNDEEAVARLAGSLHLALCQDGPVLRVFADGRDLTGEIRSEKISAVVPHVAGNSRVRKRMAALQREMAAQGPIVMEGRDIGSVVFPDAEVKIFLSAGPEERARRRVLQLETAGQPADPETVLREVLRRDELDSTRKDSPLRVAPGAVKLDTTGLSIEETVERIVTMVRATGAGSGRIDGPKGETPLC